MNKLLIICGPTATGKTNFALQLTKLLPSDIISADSRQVYIGADIVTGKDKPTDQTIYGLDLVPPSTQYNVSDWQQYALKTISAIHRQNRLPIVVGGTGLYIKSLLESMPTLHVPPNTKLRAQLENTSPTQLFDQLKKIDPQKAATMNDSDKYNPRRLIRAIEVASSELVTADLPKFNSHIVGLTCSLQLAAKRITLRVQDRINEGAKSEYERLVSQGFAQYLPSIAAGYKYIDQPDQWISAELQLFRRQMTWFKKTAGITWYDIEELDWQSSAIANIQQWTAA